MSNLKHLFFNLIVGLLVLGLFCPGAYAKKNTVVIGFTGPLSGPAAQYGQDNVAGLEMAIQDINAAGGIKIDGKAYTFKLKTYDDGIDPTAAVNNARRLRSRDGARVVFNPVFNTLAPLMQVNQQRGSEFLVMAYTSTPKVDEMKNPLTIAVPPPFSAYVKAYVEYTWNKGLRKGAMVCTLGAYGDAWRHEFKDVWIARGGEITADKPANYYTETDFSAQLSAALSTKPEFLLIGGPSDPTGLVIEQARNLGFKGDFILIDQAKMNYIGDVGFKGDLSKLNGVLGVARPLEYGPAEIMKPFIDRYKRDYGRPATSENVLNYSAMRILAGAMEAAGTVEDIKAIKAAFSEILPMDPKDNLIAYMGIDGSRMIISGTIQTIENGKYTPPIANVWWTKSDADYQEAIKALPDVGGTFAKIPLEGYAK